MLDIVLGAITLKTRLVGVTAGLLVYWILQKYRYKLPPGPLALPIIGNMLQFKTEMIHEEIYEMSKKYGPVMSVYLGSTLTIVCNDLESALEALIKKGTDFANRLRPPSLEFISESGKDIAFGDYSPAWRLHRKIASKALRHYMQGEALEERVHNAVSVMFEEMVKEKKPFDPRMYVNFIVGNILSGLCFAGKYSYNDPELVKILSLDDEFLETLAGGGLPEDIVPALQYVWESKKMHRLKEGMTDVLENFLYKKYREHVETFDRGNIRDFTDTLILARLEAEEDPNEADLDKLTDTHIVQTLSDIFFAGLDTSRFTIQFALLHMAAYPEIQKKVREEIDNVVGIDQLPKMVHRPQLPYTEAVLHESMRLGTVLPTGVPHKATCDTSIGQYDVPKDTVVMINHWALHHDPKKWEKVHEFIPERFLDANGKLGPKPENWLPFSAGRRVCLGETVAKPELHLIFACLIQRFKWRLADNEKADLRPDGGWFGLVPKQHKFIIEDRKA